MNWAQVLIKVLELLDIKRILASFFFGLVTRIIVPNDIPLNALLVSKTEGTWAWLLFVYSAFWYILFLFVGWINKKINERVSRKKQAIELQEKIKKEEKEHIARYELLPNGCTEILKFYLLNNNKCFSLDFSDERHYILNQTEWIIVISRGSVNNGTYHLDIMLKPEIYADIKKLYDAGKLFVDLKDNENAKAANKQ